MGNAMLRLYRANVGTVKTAEGRIFSTGLPKGFSDFFGVLPAEKSRSGHAIPIFLEAKTSAGKPSSVQLEFLERQRSIGAVAGTVHTVQEARRRLEPHIIGGDGDGE